MRRFFLPRVFLPRFFSTCILWNVFFCTLGVVSAQTSSIRTSSTQFSVGAVLPLSGDSANAGRVAAAALRASAETLLRTGISVELTILDSRSDAVYAAAQTKSLIAAGVHALLCCDDAQTAAQIAPTVAAAGIPTLSLAPVTPEEAGGEASGGRVIFSLAAGDSVVLTKLASGPLQAPLALLAPQGAFGDQAADRLRGVSVGIARYPAQSQRTSPTPEALLVATRGPGSVVIWDDAAGTLRAAAALRARGYTGVRVVRAEVWDELGALGRAELTGAVSVVGPAVLGYLLPDVHSAKQSVSSFRRSLSGVLFEGAEVETISAAAKAWDAAQLIGAAAEQVLTYTDLAAPVLTGGAAEPESVRSALRDALIGLGPVAGVSGSYDFSGDRAAGVLADSLVLAAWQGGRFLPLP